MNLVQGQDFVSNYFTKLKVFWEELSNYSSNCTCGLCICGGAREKEQVMSFLMGLNDTYAQIQGQILLMDPLTFVNKIFSLVIQEERQRDVGLNQSNTPLMAFNVRSNNSSNKFQNHHNSGSNYKNNGKSPFCTHCKRLGHVQDKCYRLHGFPPRYKNKQSNDNRINSISFHQPEARVTINKMPLLLNMKL